MSGKGPRVIVFADASVLRGQCLPAEMKTGAALKETHLSLVTWTLLVPLSSAGFDRLSEMDLSAFIRTADPRKVRIVERARAENERLLHGGPNHRTVTLLRPLWFVPPKSCRLVWRGYLLEMQVW
ncbi:hypothetical protein Tco_0743196 [Tanacetum coccineum]